MPLEIWLVKSLALKPQPNKTNRNLNISLNMVWVKPWNTKEKCRCFLLWAAPPVRTSISSGVLTLAPGARPTLRDVPQFRKVNGSVQDQPAGLTISSARTVHVADFKKTALSTRVVTPLLSKTPPTKPAQKFCEGKPWGCYDQGPQATGAGRGRAPTPRRKGRIQAGRRTAFRPHLIQLRPRCRPTAECEAVPQALRAGYTLASERRTSASRSALPSAMHLHQTKTSL